MPSLIFPTSVPMLVLITAVGYALATAGMKLCAEDAVAAGVVLILVGLTVAILAEIVLLRSVSLSAVYITIVAAETLLVFAYAASLGESLSLRQTGGAMMVLLGLVAIST